jgi:hypothetical protein
MHWPIAGAADNWRNIPITLKTPSMSEMDGGKFLA